MKFNHLSLALLLTSSALRAAAPTLLESAGWLESAWVTWKPVSGAQSYNVYVTGGSVANQKLDNPLIRSYGSYWRADALGLKPGSYTLKVVPVTGGTEGTATTTSTLTVTAHDRSGFAFSGGRVPGAYNTDGTLKTGAVVLYLTQLTKDTMSLTVTGANANPCVGIETILDAFNKGKDSRPLDVRVIGNVTTPSYSADGDLLLQNKQNAAGSVTLEGVGTDATANGWGVRMKSASNVEVRNLGVMNVNSTALDDIGLQQDCDHVWVHHNDHFYGSAGSASDQVKGDGAMDVKLSTYVTIAYEHFWDNGKCSLLGLSEDTTLGLYITYHHNWFDHSDSRHPRVRFYSAHVYNNYYDGNDKYGAGSTMASSVFMEGNYFRNCRYPMLTSMQGTDVWNPSTKQDDPKNYGTFSSEDGGTIKAWNNHIEGAERFVGYGDTAYPNSTVDFDAYVVKSRTDKVPSSVKSYQGAHVYNNFDTDNSVMYTYTVDSPDAARLAVIAGAGRLSGGDFKWTFNNAVDDTSAAVNAGLKSALVNYAGTLASIQGIGTVGSGTTAVQPEAARTFQPLRLDGANRRLALDPSIGTGTATFFLPTGAVLRHAVADAAGLSLEGLPRGVVMVRVSTDRGTFQQRFVME
jgi:pectate lyase